MTTAREETVRLADLLRREHAALAEFLVALATFDRERRWVELGHSSLFYFLTRELGLPKGPAFYRKTGAELIQRFPELVAPLRDGRLHLTSLVELAKVITPENRAEVLPRFFHTSKREAKEVSAAIAPAAAPALRTVVTAVRPAAPASAPNGDGPASAGGILRAGAKPDADGSALDPGRASPALDPKRASPVLPEEPVRANPTAHDVAPATALVRAPAKTPAVEPLTADLRRLHLTVSRRLLDKLAAARDALSHSHPDASEDEILEVGLDLILERHAKRRGLVAKPRMRTPSPQASVPTSPRASVPTPPRAPAPTTLATRAAAGASERPDVPRSRHVPAAVLRAVWKRDEGKCQWPVDGGGVCASTHRVELDHVDGFALGGETSVDRCRLLCGFHNDVHARALYGDAVMDTYTRPKGNGCSEPVAAWRTSTARAARRRVASLDCSSGPSPHGEPRLLERPVAAWRASTARRPSPGGEPRPRPHPAQGRGRGRALPRPYPAFALRYS